MVKDILEAIQKKNFEHRGVSIEYESERPDECRCGNDYHRCSYISSKEVEEVDLEGVAIDIENCLKIKADDVIKRYAIRRSLSTLRMWKPSVWEIHVRGGYYGEEIGGVYLDSDEAQKLSKALEEAFKKESDSLRSMMEYLLEIEYGYILDAMKGAIWDVVVVNVTQINVGQQDYFRRLDQDVVKQYEVESYQGCGKQHIPVCVCELQSDGTLKIVDGYHRFAAVNNSGTKRVKVITFRLNGTVTK